MRPKSRIIVNNKKSSKNIFILLALVILGLFAYFFINSNEIISFVHSKNPVLTPTPTLIPTPTETPTPTATPSPTLTPTPTPIPLVGYCLNVPVLFYHHVQPQQQAIDKKQTPLSVDNGVFDQQIGYLTSHGYNLISAKELVDALRNKSGLPVKSMLITLDDGYLDNYQYAFPVMQKYHVKANLMISTGLLGGADYMSWGQLEEMQRSGLIYWTDHTWSHFALGNGTPDKIKYEIDTARDQLQQHTGQIVNVFTYPYGSFNNRSIQILSQEGFIGAFSTISGNWQCDSFIMALHRKRIGNASMSYYGF